MRLRHREVLTIPLVSKREEINRIDYKVLELLAERLAVCKDIGEYKRRHDLPITDSSREEALLEDRTRYLASLGIDDRNFVESLYKTIMEGSKKLQLEGHLYEVK